MAKWAAVALVGAMLGSGSAWARKLEGMEIPERVNVAGKSLMLNGSAVQKKFIFDVYVVALFLESPTSDDKAALTSEQAKRIQLKLLRGASKSQIADALRKGFERGNQGRGIAHLEERLERLLAQVPDMRAGDELTITYVPGDGTTVNSRRGGKLTLPGADFAQAMFSVWLGKDKGTERIKGELLEGGARAAR